MSDELPIQSKYAGLVERAKAILMQPKAEWPRIAAETTEPTKVLTSYVVPLALIGPVAGLIGMQLFGVNVLFATYRPTIASSLTMAVIQFVMTIVGVFVLSFIANWLAPKFGGRDNFPAAFRLVAYSMTAAWVAAIFGLIPSLALIGSLIGLYSFYLYYLGAEPVMGVPKDKTLSYTVVTVLAAIGIYLVIGLITASVAGTASMATGAIAADEMGEATIDLGELGKVELDGDMATLTVDGEEVKVDLEQARAAAEAAEARSGE
jgi:hypothetical protein